MILVGFDFVFAAWVGFVLSVACLISGSSSIYWHSNLVTSSTLVTRQMVGTMRHDSERSSDPTDFEEVVHSFGPQGRSQDPKGNLGADPSGESPILL